MKREFKRSDVWLADLGNGDGSEQRGVRPVLIIQNDVGNFFSPTVIVAAITDGKKKDMPTHALIPHECQMFKDSVVMLEQIRTIDKKKLSKKIAILPELFMLEVDEKLKISVGLVPAPVPRREATSANTQTRLQKVIESEDPEETQRARIQFEKAMNLYISQVPAP